MTYSMEATIEATRLEEQVFQKNYNIAEELSRFQFSSTEVVLDAGCGTGVLARYLADQFNIKKIDGLDYSDLRIKQASDFSKAKAGQNIQFYQQDLSNINPEFHNKYDTVICRYVLEHTPDPIKVMKELKKTLKTNGRLIIFELDGVFINLYSQNKKFNEYMKEITKNFNFDLEIGRKLPSLLKMAGFKNVEWDAELISCKRERLREEILNTEKRFIALEPYLTQMLGSSLRYQEFAKLYLEEMAQPENTLVFTKYICSAT